MDETRDMMSVQDVADLTGFSTSLIYKMHREGRMPGAADMQTKLLRWRRGDIAEWISGDWEKRKAGKPV